MVMLVPYEEIAATADRLIDKEIQLTKFEGDFIRSMMRIAKNEEDEIVEMTRNQARIYREIRSKLL